MKEATIYECKMVIAGLMLLRKNLDQHTWSEGDIEEVMKRIMMQGTPDDAKRFVPDAYAVCFPATVLHAEIDRSETLKMIHQIVEKL